MLDRHNCWQLFNNCCRTWEPHVDLWASIWLTVSNGSLLLLFFEQIENSVRSLQHCSTCSITWLNWDTKRDRICFLLKPSLQLHVYAVHFLAKVSKVLGLGWPKKPEKSIFSAPASSPSVSTQLMRCRMFRWLIIDPSVFSILILTIWITRWLWINTNWSSSTHSPWWLLHLKRQCKQQDNSNYCLATLDVNLIIAWSSYHGFPLNSMDF